MKTLRPYQQQAVDASFKDWEDCNSTLMVLPTGTGKTICFAEVARRFLPGRTLVVAHREELLGQAKRHLQDAGLEVELEMAEYWATSRVFGSSAVVATVQSLVAGINTKRMERFRPEDFSLVVIDEAHHATANTYRQVIEYFTQNFKLKVLGVTATPDRADEIALGQVFQSVAFDYEILDAINDGWLVPIEQQMVTIEGLDFSQIRTTAGDLNNADLEEVMTAEKNLHGVVSATLDIIGLRPTLVFAVTVKQAEKYAEIFNRHRPDMAEFVSGKTPKHQRHEIFHKFKNGAIQVLVNVGVATEGYDNPRVEVIVQARPTKSRCLYSQMIGRSTRPLEGLVDNFDTPERRRAAIAASIKPHCLVIDFAGNSGKHKLITTADILGGKVSEEAIERATAKAKAAGRPINMAQALDEEEAALQERAAAERRQRIEDARRREAARKAGVVGHAQYSTRTIDPFNVFEMSPARERGWDFGKQLSEKQLDMLRRSAIDPDELTYAEGRQVLNEMFRRIKGGLASVKQLNLLKKNGYSHEEVEQLKFTDASKLIEALKQNHWRRPSGNGDGK